MKHTTMLYVSLLVLAYISVSRAQDYLIYDRYNSPLSSDADIEEMDIDHEGNVWCVSGSQLVKRSVGGEWHVFDKEFGNPGVSGVVVLKDQSVLVSSRRGFFRYDGLEWSRLTADDLGGATVRLTCDTNGIVWYFRRENLYQWNGTSTVQIASPCTSNIDDLCVAHDNTLWVRVRDTLYQRVGNSWTTWYDSTGRVSGISRMTEWRGGIWCWSNFGNLSNITNDSAHWGMLDDWQGPFFPVYMMAEAADGRLWIISKYNEIYAFDTDTLEYIHDLGWMAYPFNRILNDQFGNMWIASRGFLLVYRTGGVVGIHSPGPDVTTSLDIFPTVATTTVTARTNRATGAQRLLLVNALGQVLDSRPVSPDETLQFSTAHLPAGVYFVQLHTSNRIITRRFVTY